MNLKFSGQGLAFLFHYMATQDIRYYLNGVYVAPLSAEAGGGVIGAATNGHVLGMWHDKEGTATRAAILRISKPLARACASKDGPGEQKPTLVLADNRLACMRGGEELYIQPNEYRDPERKPRGGWANEPWEVPGNFPNIARVVPDHTKAEIGMTGSVNATLLALVTASLPKSRSRYGTGVTIRQINKDSGNLVLFDGLPEAMAVIMPMRTDFEVPAWLPRWRDTEIRSQDAAKLPTPGSQPSDAAPPEGFIADGKFHGHSGAPA